MCLVTAHVSYIVPQGPATWCGKYYKYRVSVYNPWSQRMEVLEATDPYSRSLAADGARTQVGLRLARPVTVDVYMTVEVLQGASC